MTARDALPDLQAAQSSIQQMHADSRVSLLYLAFDSNDSRVLHRAHTLESAGAQLTLAAFRRERTPALPAGNWQSVDLGLTIDEDYRDRILSVVRGARILWRERTGLRNIQGIIARNLEQLILARLARRILGKQIPIAYECLDIHRLMVGTGVVSSIFRLIERSCLKQCALLIVSSPAYIEQYFKPTQRFAGKWQLIENKMPPGFTAPVSRATDNDRSERPQASERPLTIGWFGILRCRKSFDMLMQIAAARPDTVRIEIRGIPSGFDSGEFEQRVAGAKNVSYGGPYRSPDDLNDLYRNIDITWAIDYFEEGACSEWLLPNRLYESGYFGVPMLTRAGTATADYVTRKRLGWSLDNPVPENAVDFIDQLTPDQLARVSNSIANHPNSAWVEIDDAGQLIANLMKTSPKPAIALNSVSAVAGDVHGSD